MLKKFHENLESKKKYFHFLAPELSESKIILGNCKKTTLVTGRKLNIGKTYVHTYVQFTFGVHGVAHGSQKSFNFHYLTREL